MHLLVICKFEEDPIKTESAVVSTAFFRRSRAGNSEVNGRVWLEFKRIRDGIAVLVTCKSDDTIKMRALLCPQHFPHYTSMGKCFGAQGQVTPKRIVRSLEIELVRDLMPVLIIYMFVEDPIKTKGAIMSTIVFQAFKGK